MAMFKDDIKNIPDTSRDFRNFGLIVGGILLGLGVWLSFSGREASLPVVVSGGALFAFGLFAPKVLRPIYHLWMILSLIIGFVMTRLILSALFFLAVTPLSLLMRALGKRSLDLRFKSDAKVSTYWRTKESIEAGKERFERQF